MEPVHIKSRQAGNAVLYVLIGIVLFAALAFTFSRTVRPAGKVSMEDARLAAQEIISYAEKVNGAVQNVMLQNGCLASQINTVAKCTISDLAGGGVVVQTPPALALDTAAAAAASSALAGSYYLEGNVCLDNTGTGPPLSACAASNAELLLIMPWVTLEVCTAINQILGNGTTVPQDAGSSFDGTSFAGTYAGTFAISTGATTYQVGCYQSSSTSPPGAGYQFYYTLLAR